MRESLIEGNTSIRYPDTIMFTGGVNSYISIINPKPDAECTLAVYINRGAGTLLVEFINIKRTAAVGRDIIFPLSDILTALYDKARNEYPIEFPPISSREFKIAINIEYDKRIVLQYGFILVNGSPAYDATVYRRESDRRRGVFWKNEYEIFEMFAPTVGGEIIQKVETDWSPSVNITDESNIINPFVSLPTMDVPTPSEGNAEVLLLVEDTNMSLILNSNFANGRKYWEDWGQPIVREIVELDGKNWAHIKAASTPWQGYQQKRQDVIKPNTTYTLSLDVRTAEFNQFVGFGIHWLGSDGATISQDWRHERPWQHWDPDTKVHRLNLISTSPANCTGFNLMIGNGGGGDATQYDDTEVWITDIMLEEGNITNPMWTSNYSTRKVPLYFDMCPLSERDMELHWYDELGVFCSWRFTEEYNETAVTNDATLTRMEISGTSLYQARTRMTRKQTTYTLHSRKVPRDVVPFIKSILSAPLVWRGNTDRHMNEMMIVEDYKEKDYGRGYVDVVIKVTDTPQSYE